MDDDNTGSMLGMVVNEVYKHSKEIKKDEDLYSFLFMKGFLSVSENYSEVDL
jgi:hypothetical protein